MVAMLQGDESTSPSSMELYDSWISPRFLRRDDAVLHERLFDESASESQPSFCLSALGLLMPPSLHLPPYSRSPPAHPSGISKT